MTGKKFLFTAMLIFTWGALLTVFAFGAPRADLWDRWTKHDSASVVRVDHSAWGRFLDDYLNTDHPGGVFMFNYSGVTPGDRELLQDYIGSLESTPVSSLNRDEQFAYWVNLYNAVTVDLILENYPLDSIRDIRDPWDTKLVKVEGTGLTLNDVEHRILRPIWQDPRIHYAVNCASYSCPNLQPRPFTAAGNEELLDKGAREYINHPRGVDVRNGKIEASSIYTWYQEDFGGTEEGVIRHWRLFADDELLVQLQGFDGRISYDYDWSLNE